MPILSGKHTLAASSAVNFPRRAGLLFNGRASIAYRHGFSLGEGELIAPNRPSDSLLDHERRGAVAAERLFAPRTMPTFLEEIVAHALRIYDSRRP